MMSVKIKAFLGMACMLMMVAGFSLSSYAFDCEQCLNGCEMERHTCIKSGQFTVAQCNQSFHTCWKLECDFCELP